MHLPLAIILSTVVLLWQYNLATPLNNRENCENLLVRDYLGSEFVVLRKTSGRDDKLSLFYSIKIQELLTVVARVSDLKSVGKKSGSGKLFRRIFITGRGISNNENSEVVIDNKYWKCVNNNL
ncbi:MAG: hypothetical protein MHMPM18_003443 [Marteilia pararefringens]